MAYISLILHCIFASSPALAVANTRLHSETHQWPSSTNFTKKKNPNRSNLLCDPMAASISIKHGRTSGSTLHWCLQFGVFLFFFFTSALFLPAPVGVVHEKDNGAFTLVSCAPCRLSVAWENIGVVFLHICINSVRNNCLTLTSVLYL